MTHHEEIASLKAEIARQNALIEKLISMLAEVEATTVRTRCNLAGRAALPHILGIDA